MGSNLIRVRTQISGILDKHMRILKDTFASFSKLRNLHQSHGQENPSWLQRGRLPLHQTAIGKFFFIFWITSFKPAFYMFVLFVFAATADQTASASGRRKTRSGGGNWRSGGRRKRPRSCAGSESERRRRRKRGRKRRRTGPGEAAAVVAAAAVVQMKMWTIILSRNPRNLHLLPYLRRLTPTLRVLQRRVIRTSFFI